MSKASLTKQKKKRKPKKLKQKRQGVNYPVATNLANRKSELKTVEEEKQAAQTETGLQLKAYCHLLPKLLNKLSKMSDPRNPNKIKHQITAMMLYGILIFAFQITSRRNANKEMTTPQLLQNLQSAFPEIEEIPHQDTLCRLLTDMDVNQVEAAYLELLRKLIRNKTFKNILHDGNYMIAIDGTQKYVMNECHDERYPCRKVKGEDGKYQYYAYVLEAVLIFSNGMVLPLMSEFLENSPELEQIEDDEEWKQDCELKAFYRLADRLKKAFPKLSITLLLDGLYANGPVMELCYKNKWNFMIVLKDKSLPSVWQEAKGLMSLDTEGEHHRERTWRRRRQTFDWVNQISYEYNLDNHKKSIDIHVVTCQESWEEIDQDGNQVTKTARHAWLSSKPINRQNVHKYCNLMARKRWLHENNILKEKHQGYQYEHIFSYDYDAMRGYHYLMHIGRMLNEMALYSIELNEQIRAVGIQYFIKKFHENMTFRALDTERLSRLRRSPGQLRLIHEDNWSTNQQVS